jgi:hypothetical protein
MPLQKLEPMERREPISLRKWKSGESRTITFYDDGRDQETVNGKMVVFEATEAGDELHKSLWIKPSSALHIGLNEFLPLIGKTLKINKEILEGDVNKGTRYTAELVSSVEVAPKVRREK